MDRPSFGGLEASSLYCPRCGKAQPVRRKLLLVLPQGEKFAYYCAQCGQEVGSKLEQSQGPPPWAIT
jgi:DNA-directed RNA polymerase subunit RPC12/RpoP